MRTHVILAAALSGLAAALLTAQTRSALGTPLPGITPVEFQEFRLGLDDFLEVEASEEGLGPAFNGTSCAVCHNIPTIGGAGTMAELRAGLTHQQLATLHSMEQFQWELRFVRRPLFDAPIPVLFNRAYCQQAVCSPSRSSLLTITWSPFDEKPAACETWTS